MYLVDIDSIRSFLLLAEIGNLAETAERLFLSTSSLTSRLKKIEKDLGDELFVLKGRNLSLSPAGQTFLHYAKQICDLQEELKHKIHYNEEGEQRFRIGVNPSISSYIFPSLIREFKSLYPNMQLKLISTTGDKVREAIINNEIDLGIVQGGAKYETLQFKKWFTELDLMVVSSENPWAEKKVINVEELKNQPLIAFQRHTFLWKKRMEWILNNGVNPWIGLGLNHIEPIKEILLNDHFGYSFLPMHGIKEELNKNLMAVKLTDSPIWKRDTYFISNKNKKLPTIYHDFVDFAIMKTSGGHTKKDGKLIS